MRPPDCADRVAEQAGVARSGLIEVTAETSSRAAYVGYGPSATSRVLIAIGRISADSAPEGRLYRPRIHVMPEGGGNRAG